MPVVLRGGDCDKWLQAPVENALTSATAYPSQLLAIGEDAVCIFCKVTGISGFAPYRSLVAMIRAITRQGVHS